MFKKMFRRPRREDELFSLTAQFPWVYGIKASWSYTPKDLPTLIRENSPRWNELAKILALQGGGERKVTVWINWASIFDEQLYSVGVKKMDDPHSTCLASEIRSWLNFSAHVLNIVTQIDGGKFLLFTPSENVIAGYPCLDKIIESVADNVELANRVERSHRYVEPAPMSW